MEKIAFLIPSMSSGGMERVMGEIVTYFSKISGYECHLVIYGKSTQDFYKVPSNVIIHRPEFKFDDNKRTWNTIKTARFIRQTIKKLKPYRILSFGEYWNNFVLLSLLGLNMPIYVSDRNSPEESLGAIHNILRELLYPRAAGVIAQTKKAEEIFRLKFKSKTSQVIGNPIREIDSQNEIEKENIIITVGRLIETKNFNRLIDIFSKLDNRQWKLIIVGGDSNKQTNSIKLQAQIDNLDLGENVILAGTQKNVEDYLLRAKIFAFTSNSEGFPNVIGEAMSAGLPVVSYDCVAGPSDMIEDGKTGFLIPLFEDDIFMEKLRFLMNNDELRNEMGIRAKESIQRYSVENIGKQFYKFIIGQ